MAGTRATLAVWANELGWCVAIGGQVFGGKVVVVTRVCHVVLDEGWGV